MKKVRKIFILIFIVCLGTFTFPTPIQNFDMPDDVQELGGQTVVNVYREKEGTITSTTYPYSTFNTDDYEFVAEGEKQEKSHRD